MRSTSSELDIMVGFMHQERRRQQALEKLEEVNKPTSSKPVNGDKKDTCHHCGKTGHFKKDCRLLKSGQSRTTVNIVNMKKLQKPCPAYGDQHTFLTQQGETI